MLKSLKLFSILILFFIAKPGWTQNLYDVDSLKTALKIAEDNERVMTLSALSFNYCFINADSGIMYGQDAINLATKMECKNCEAIALLSYGWALANYGTHDKAVEYTLKSIHLNEELKDYEWIISGNNSLASIYTDARDFNLAIRYNNEAIRIHNLHYASDTGLNLTATIFSCYVIRAYTFITAGDKDSAAYYMNKVSLADIGSSSFALYTLGNIEFLNGNYEKAISYFKRTIPVAVKSGTLSDILESYAGLSAVYLQKNMPDSAVYFGMRGLNKWRSTSYKVALLKLINRVAAGYKMLGNSDSAIRYLELSRNLTDSLYNQEKIRRIQNLDFAEQLHKREVETANKEFRSKIKLYGLTAVLAASLLVAVILYRTNRQKQKANELLQIEKEKVDQTLKVLKSTQAQLIQTEKMASLGQLTAGIAHEIQNPLNFVNNFSDVNKELIEELEAEMARPPKERNETRINEILNFITHNLHKISEHGKRAESIVHGMLQHSRTNTGQKELTDINSLAGQFMQLAYHGFRVKDNAFNVSSKTDLDPSVGKIDIVPQDIGRVMLNLLNNAFYAVIDKKRTSPNGYDPTVKLSTRMNEGHAEIIIEDNGNGISQKNLDRIFQPFFTTKPSGQGTGLGLSLSYDIIKAHGGKIKVASIEGEGSKFIVSLPV
jgi:signal transduction histidine kinase